MKFCVLKKENWEIDFKATCCPTSVIYLFILINLFEGCRFLLLFLVLIYIFSFTGWKGFFVRSITAYWRVHWLSPYLLRSFHWFYQDLQHWLDFWYSFCGLYLFSPLYYYGRLFILSLSLCIITCHILCVKLRGLVGNHVIFIDWNNDFPIDHTGFLRVFRGCSWGQWL